MTDDRYMRFYKRAVNMDANKKTCGGYLNMLHRFVPQCEILDAEGCEILSAMPQGSIALSQLTEDSRAVLIGKGILFDAGGWNLKNYECDMHDMFADMAGSALTAAAHRSVYDRYEDPGIAWMSPLAVNYPTPLMYPGGIYTIGNHIVEVIDTDAEGRLVLAECMAWIGSRSIPPKHMITVGTLCGAGDLGPTWGTWTTNSDILADYMQAAVSESKEKFWRYPLDFDQLPGLKSTRSDLMNVPLSTSIPMGHSMDAPLFLSHFVPEETEWLHIDIADAVLRNRKASGFGLTTLIKLLESIIEAD